MQAAAALREEAVPNPITLVSQEPHLPYDRPPLSKRLLLGEAEPGTFQLRDAAFYAQHAITLALGERVESLDTASRRVRFASSASLEYSHLVLATGSTSRALGTDGAGLEGVVMLRSLDEALVVRSLLREARRIAVVGAGFIGMEVAAVAAKLGRLVHVIELGLRPLARAVSPATSNFFACRYAEKGIGFTFGERIDRLLGHAGQVCGVRLGSGAVMDADLVLVAVGAVPCDGLAARAGLPCSNGVHVNGAMRTADPQILAIGDCALHPNKFAGRTLRLESVQNAVDQARVAARAIAGKPGQYCAVPWFWSDLGEWRLQIAGLMDGCDRHVVRGSLELGKYSIFGYRAGKLAGVESVNRAADHLLAKRLLAAEVAVPPELAADESRDLKKLVQVAVSQGGA